MKYKVIAVFKEEDGERIGEYVAKVGYSIVEAREAAIRMNLRSPGYILAIAEAMGAKTIAYHVRG